MERGSKRKLDAQATQDRQRLAVLEEQVQQLLRKEKSEIAIAQEIERSRALDAEETKKAVYAYERNLGLKFIKRRGTFSDATPLALISHLKIKRHGSPRIPIHANQGGLPRAAVSDPVVGGRGRQVSRRLDDASD